MPDARAIALTFDVDGVTPWLNAERLSPWDLSRGEFSERGVHRLLDLLDHLDVKATFFFPGYTARAMPATVSRLLEAGHEIGVHGWRHRAPDTLTADEERQEVDRGIEAVRALGVVPVGYRVPFWRPTFTTFELLCDAGLQYDSSLMGTDVEPYWCRRRPEWTDDRYTPGARLPLVEMPVAPHLDDAAQYEIIPVEGIPGLRPPVDVVDTWLRDVELLARVGGVLTITMHPEVTGRAHRLLALQEFVEKVLAAQPDIAFQRLDVAQAEWRAGQSR